MKHCEDCFFHSSSHAPKISDENYFSRNESCKHSIWAREDKDAIPYYQYSISKNEVKEKCEKNVRENQNRNYRRKAYHDIKEEIQEINETTHNNNIEEELIKIKEEITKLGNVSLNQIDEKVIEKMGLFKKGFFRFKKIS